MNKSRTRLCGIAIFILFLFSLLIAQFYKIQIIEGDKWTRQAQKQHFFIVNEPFRRGRFFSNTSISRKHPEIPQSFVIDVQKFHLHIDPEAIPEEHRDFLAKNLVATLDLSVEENLRCREQFNQKSRNRKIATWLDRETKDAVMEWWLPYARKHKIPRNAFFFVSDFQRSYPFGKLLGQVLHTIQNQKNEQTGQGIPTGGLELYYDPFLRGKQGKRRLMRSPRNSFEMGEIIAFPENGADVYLTINHNLQEIAEEELAKGVKQAKAKGGWAVVMNPYTGEILALAQYPFFSPPEYQTFFNEKSMMDHTRVKAVTDANEPGSVMKPITAAVAMIANEVLKSKGEKELFDPDEKADTSNSRFPGRSKPLKDTSFHKALNMNMALQKSSNIYMARLTEKIIARLGNNWYRETLHNVFGMGQKTHIELFSESPGLLPTPGKKHPNGTLEWSTATPFSMAMGHNIQVSAVQLARAYAVIANRGYLVQPTLVRKIVKRSTSGEEVVLVDHTQPDRLEKFPKVLSNSIIERLIIGMKYVTKRGGSSSKGDIRGYTEAGKSGTANKIVGGTYSQKLYCSSFAGFAPVKNPAFVCVVTIDEPEYGFVPGVGKKHHGGHAAAPVFREIGRRTLEYLGIAPDDPHGYPVGDPRFDPEKADWIKETRLLKEMYEKWNNSKNDT